MLFGYILKVIELWARWSDNATVETNKQWNEITVVIRILLSKCSVELGHPVECARNYDASGTLSNARLIWNHLTRNIADFCNKTSSGKSFLLFGLVLFPCRNHKAHKLLACLPESRGGGVRIATGCSENQRNATTTTTLVLHSHHPPTSNKHAPHGNIKEHNTEPSFPGPYVEQALAICSDIWYTHETLLRECFANVFRLHEF